MFRISDELFFRFLEFRVNYDSPFKISSLNKLLGVPTDWQHYTFSNPIPVIPNSFSLFSPFTVLLLVNIITLEIMFSTIFDS